MKQTLILLLLVVLAACAGVPAPGAGSELQPLTLGTASNDGVFGVAAYRAGVYAVGETFGDLHGPAQGGGDAFVRKYADDGQVLWGRQFGSSAFDTALGVAADAADNVYVGGYTEGSLGDPRGGIDGFLRKYNPQGAVVWTRQYGGPNRDVISEVAVSGNTVFLTGEIRNLETDDSSAALIKVAADGTRQWTRVFGTDRPDSAFGVAADALGNAYVTGYTLGSLAAPNGGGYDLFLRKYRPNGNVAWTRQLHLSDRDIGKAVAVTGDAVYLVSDFWQGDNFDDLDVRVLKFGLAGELLWDRRFGRVSDDIAIAAATGGGELYFSGTTATAFAGTNRGQFDGYVVKLAVDGRFVWGKRQGTAELDESDGVTFAAGSVYAGGGTAGSLGGPNRGGRDGFVRRLEAARGGTLWTD